MRIGFIIFIFLNTIVSYGQPGQHELLFSHEIETKLATQKISSSTASYNYTYIGDYQKAISTYDIPVSWGLDSIDLSKNILEDAVDKVIKQAKKHNVIIISESHLKPQHRIFAKTIIDSLSYYGFNHLGIETLSPDYSSSNQLADASLSERGYALNSPITGHYTREPQMADLVRTALRKKYKLFAYERIIKIPGKDREEIQADNIIRYINTNNAKKLILICGWHHAIESTKLKRGKYFYMAKYLKDKTGIDPLTIYQDNFTEKVYENEHTLLQQKWIQNPSIIVNNDGKIVQLTDHVDIEIIHPKTKYVKGRPHWLFQNSLYKEYRLDKKLITIGYPIIFKAFMPEEFPLGVPIDIIELKHKYDNKALVLKSGKYIIQIENNIGKQEFDVNIE